MRDSCAGCGAGTGGNGVHNRCQLLFRMRWLLPNHVHQPWQDGWQVETWSQTVWSACAAVRRVLCEDAHQMHTAVLDRVHSADPTSDRRTLTELARETTLYLIPECDTEEDVIRCWSICPTNH